jgi:DNA polymerase-3 subunit alpha
MNPQEVESRFKDFPDALKTAMEIAERCKFDLPIGKPQMPIVPLLGGVTITPHLRSKLPPP